MPLSIETTLRNRYGDDWLTVVKKLVDAKGPAYVAWESHLCRASILKVLRKTKTAYVPVPFEQEVAALFGSVNTGAEILLETAKEIGVPKTARKYGLYGSTLEAFLESRRNEPANAFEIARSHKRVDDIEADYPFINTVPTGEYDRFKWRDGVLYAQQWYMIR